MTLLHTSRYCHYSVSSRCLADGALGSCGATIIKTEGCYHHAWKAAHHPWFRGGREEEKYARATTCFSEIILDGNVEVAREEKRGEKFPCGESELI